MRQEKEDITAYTWISTDSGRKLADKTGFRSDKQIFEDINQIWSRTF